MPRSRNSRSNSPKKNVSNENLVEAQRKKTLEAVKDIFCESVDEKVIELVLAECEWKEEEAVEKILVIAASSEEQRKYKSKLHTIAEGVLGPLRPTEVPRGGESQGARWTPASGQAGSSLSQSEKVIRRPTKQGDDKSKAFYPATDKFLQQRVNSPVYTLGAKDGNETEQAKAKAPVEVSDLHFPRLPSKAQVKQSSGSSSVSSQRSYNDLVKQSVSSKGVLLSQAQNAYHQQFDDAEGAQRWEEYKQKLSEHYMSSISVPEQAKDVNVHSTSRVRNSAEQVPAFIDDPAIVQAEVAKPESNQSGRRSQSGRSFPVRLLSNSPDEGEEKAIPDLITQTYNMKQEERAQRLNSSDLDETVLNCIYEVHDDLLDESELARRNASQMNEEGLGAEAGAMGNKPMTLPTMTIGLSVEAAEFVPRPKPATSAAASDEGSTTGPTSKVARSSSVEIKPGVRNSKRQSPTAKVGSPLGVKSPLGASPSISPVISPPSLRVNTASPATNLTGSPMFITPKWPPPPMYHSMARPPPILAPGTTRFVATPPNPTHLPPPGAPGLGFPVFSQRMVYSVAPPPMLHMAGVAPQYVQQQPPVSSNIEEQAAIATGQPIMATSESSKVISPSGSVKYLNQSSSEQKLARIQAHHQYGKKVMIIMRGLPGSGKTTLARALQLNGLVLSTDDYFMKGHRYEYQVDKLTEAHQWNRERAKEAMKLSKSPIIIDNTNTQKWEFKPYISMATNFKYEIEIMEPDTPWKFDPNTLAKRNVHYVPKDQIQRMCSRYEHNITVEMMLSKKKQDHRVKEEHTDVTGKDEETIDREVKHATENAGAAISIDIQRERSSSRGSPFIVESQSRGGRDMSRLHNLYRGDDLKVYKHRSAESDSDSLSTENMSLHSEPWSNTSSRTASPKTLRPSLKTPVVLQKLEMSRQAPVRHQSVRPLVKKVKRKAIKQIEAKLSEETRRTVDEIIGEHAKGQIVSVDDVSKLEEELKALLAISLSNEDEITAAEELIGLKLHDVINKSFELEEHRKQEGADSSENESSDKENQPEVKPETVKGMVGNSDESGGGGPDKGLEGKNTNFVDDFSSGSAKGSRNVVSEVSESGFVRTEEPTKAADIYDSDDDNRAGNGENVANGNTDEVMMVKRLENVNIQPSGVSGVPVWTRIASQTTQQHHIHESLVTNIVESSEGVESMISVHANASNTNIAEIKGGARTDFEMQYWGKGAVTQSGSTDLWAGNGDVLYGWNGEVVTHEKVEKLFQSVNKPVTMASSNSGVNIKENGVTSETDVEVNWQEPSELGAKVNKINGQLADSELLTSWTDNVEVKPQRKRKHREMVAPSKSTPSSIEDSSIEGSSQVRINGQASLLSQSDITLQSDINGRPSSKLTNDLKHNSDIHHHQPDDNIDTEKLVTQSPGLGNIDSVLNSESSLEARCRNIEEISASTTVTEGQGDETVETNGGLQGANKVNDTNNESGDSISDSNGALSGINMEKLSAVNTQHVDSERSNVESDIDTGVTVMGEEKLDVDGILQAIESSTNSSLKLLKEAYVDSNSEGIEDLEEIVNQCLLDTEDDRQQIHDGEVDKDTEITGCSNGVDNTGSEISRQRLTEDTSKSIEGEAETPENGSNGGITENGQTNSESGVIEESVATNESGQKNGKKPLKRKTNGKVRQGPLLRQEDKEMFKNSAWNSFPLVSSSPTKVVRATKSEEKTNATGAATLSNDVKATSTEVEYFNMVEALSKGGFVDGSIKYLTGKTWKVFYEAPNAAASNGNDTGQSENIPVHRTQDKSTTTDDLDAKSDEENVEFLQTCFPDVPTDELECVLDNCANNVEWAINLLLDWNFSLHFTEDEKKQFTDGMKKIQRCTSPEAVKPAQEDVESSGPNSLLDMCFEKIEKENIATREEIERQMIQKSRDRLAIIETLDISKVRFHRSTSMSESSALSQSRLSIGHTDTSVFRSISTPGTMPNGSLDHFDVAGEIIQNNEELGGKGDNRIDKGDDIALQRELSHDNRTDNTDSSKKTDSKTESSTKRDRTLDEIEAASHKKVTVDKIIKQLASGMDYNASMAKHKDVPDHLTQTSTTLEESNRTSTPKELATNLHLFDDVQQPGHGETGTYGATSLESHVTSLRMPVLDVDRGFIEKLEEMFGKIPGRNDACSRMRVQLDENTACMLYHCIANNSVESDHSAQLQQQLLNDEELARKLQEEENMTTSGGDRKLTRLRPRVDLPSTRSRPTPLVGMSVLGTVPPETRAPVAAWRPGYQSLADIMKEEQRLQDGQQEIQKMLHKESNQIAVKLRREKLYQMFPRIDRKCLDDIFQANCFSLKDTAQWIKESEGMWTMSENDLEREHQLIEVTKQHSMQEMLDSYLYTPNVSKDFQDGFEPEYEDIRGEANVHHRLRHECFQKAKEAYRRNLKQVASFYSQQGHQHTKKIKEANMRASEQILSDRKLDLDKKQMLDLHGLHVDEAIAALDRIIPQKEKDRWKHVTIITGRGSHSKGGVARLRPCVIAYLNRLGYNYTEAQTGVLKVSLNYRPR